MRVALVIPATGERRKSRLLSQYGPRGESRACYPSTGPKRSFAFLLLKGGRLAALAVFAELH